MAKDRIADAMAKEAVVLQAVAASVTHKSGGRHLKNVIKKLRGEDDG
jgi:hypothetical protein